ncbi:MAG: hypothetical protein OQK69_09760 [Gammaproteobacteria bacterium]|nr:hypothetical protein [Gammaproteobacteria bacterium]
MQKIEETEPTNIFSMVILLKVLSVLFSGVFFLAYGWWDREYLTFLEKMLWLSPAYSLLIIGVFPFRFLRLKVFRLITTIVIIMGLFQLMHEAVNSINIPVEADKNAIVLYMVMSVLLGSGLYIIWRKTR